MAASCCSTMALCSSLAAHCKIDVMMIFGLPVSISVVAWFQDYQCIYNSAKSMNKFHLWGNHWQHGDSLLFAIACGPVPRGVFPVSIIGGLLGKAKKDEKIDVTQLVGFIV
ncbi:hypothetical protein Dsin_022448 [Dipteronia sinensis]|uniref:Uncharacterized protein n=1 Tax=Dipteronia sinensis TaxID=43782 RepID=A0AAE0A1F3_9ROSI|nr:hypothetical protein Dsin_022448 [Dipteronia sinensis]